ncbi:MAG TPA: DUF3426 domain-containing protein, partial [Steroidobacteraceae bacterium]|nr:DUF3426 domain-containing protein [Steroidobacteraceae bacterium]
GRCSSVFNALARLSEERQAGPAAPPPAEAAAPEPPSGEFAAASPHDTDPGAGEPASPETAAPGPAAPEPPAPEESPPDEALEFNPATTDVNSVFIEAPPDPKWAAATGSFKSLVAANQEVPEAERLPDSQVDVEIDASFLASMLRSGEPAAAGPEDKKEPVPAPAAAGAPQAPALAPAPEPTAPGMPAAAAASSARPDSTRGTRHQAPHARPAQAAVAHGAALKVPPPRFERFPEPTPARQPPAPVATRPAPAPAAEAPAHADEPHGEAAPEGTDEPTPALAPLKAWVRAHAWHLGALGALVLLALQVVNHNRDELAASAAFNAPLTRLYGALGIALYPRWDLQAYDVRQLGATAGDSGAGVITVRATVKNASAAAQPLPLLRVTLQDRFGNRIATRDVPPRAYLPDQLPASTLMAAGQRIDAEMGFADPGKDAVGFEIDACLPARGGISCANDSALR